jgi:hypothetical protein
MCLPNTMTMVELGYHNSKAHCDVMAAYSGVRTGLRTCGYVPSLVPDSGIATYRE